LRALEWDRLDLIDDRAEAARILRQYTRFLGFGEDAAPRRRTVERRLSLRSAAGVLNVLLLGVVAIPLIAAAVYLLGGFRDSAESKPPNRQGVPAPPAPPAETTQSNEAVAPRRRAQRKAERKVAARPPVRLVLTAAVGDSWVEAHAGSPTGPLLFSGTLASGRTLLLTGRRLWLRLGAASNLVFTLNGKRADPDLFGTVEAIATPQGLEPA
jgi:hypothetical protein